MNRTDWDNMGKYLAMIGASANTCVAVAGEVFADNQAELELGVTSRHFHARKFLAACGWKVEPGRKRREAYWEQKYVTREQMEDKLASLHNDPLGTADEQGLY